MAPWIQIAKPFSYHFAVNCLKTIIGSAFIGHGVTVLLATTTTTHTSTSRNNNNDDDDDSCGDNGNDKSDDDNNNDNNNNNEKKYNSTTIVAATTTIGFGLFLALPSLMSQIVWETLIPIITATDLAYDISAKNAGKVLPKFPNFPKFSKLQLPKL